MVSISFAPFIQAENFAHPVFRQRIIAKYVFRQRIIAIFSNNSLPEYRMWKNLCVDKWRETGENHRKSNVFNTSRYKWENDNLLTKHTLLYHTALTTRARKSIPSSNLCPLWNNQSSQPFPNYNLKPTVSRSLIDAQHSQIFSKLRVV